MHLCGCNCICEKVTLCMLVKLFDASSVWNETSEKYTAFNDVLIMWSCWKPGYRETTAAGPLRSLRVYFPSYLPLTAESVHRTDNTQISADIRWHLMTQGSAIKLETHFVEVQRLHLTLQWNLSTKSYTLTACKRTLICPKLAVMAHLEK